jgi:hypothetical protein
MRSDMRKLAIGGGVLVAVGIVITVLLLAAPGGNSLAEAADRLEGQNVRMAVNIGFSQDGEDASMTGTAVMNADGTRTRMDVTTTYEGENQPIKQTVLTIGDDTWFTGEGFEELLPEGRAWVHSVDRTSAANTMTMAEFADFLAGADEIEDKGEVQIRGKKTTHYQGRVNARALAEETGGETAERFEQLLADQDVYLPIEAWIDEQGLPARITLTVGSKSTTADILEYGVPVDVQPPAAADTMEEDDYNKLTSE